MIAMELHHLVRPRDPAHWRGCALLAALLTQPAGLAAADDWPQHRHDAWHTGASQDRLPLPLTDVWYWGGGDPQALGPCVVWHDRVFFVAKEGGLVQLICADARTG